MKTASQALKSHKTKATQSVRSATENAGLPTELTKALGERIANLRERLGISQEDLAAAAEIERSRISKIENGRVNCSLLTLGTIAFCLDVNMSQLFNTITHTHPPTSQGGGLRRSNQAVLDKPAKPSTKRRLR
ncbi:helix-turn-helix transcriptional regulator [Variovorax sp. PCZ-1]|uniref:helix-turn-helix domain-containing protein n=1 Tax=Variovorax sp. PCZ-1 TaxID=2835533 RepID=UPI001BCA716D|nr:helix-turn-helix transcriptional regulator [Variovorax sp. PCZ-1]MBS7809233.1 helix-turn-helix transcriptional regulator [Variovorax sp. PCZ-1]